MVNTNIQGVVPLAGKGLVYKPSNDFKPGEYAFLTNAEVTTDGTLRGRRAVRGLENDTIYLPSGPFKHAYSPSSNLGLKYEIIGEIAQHTIAISGDKQVAIRNRRPYEVAYMWPKTDLPANEWIVGAFLYNNIMYWITQNNNRVISSTKQINIYYVEYDVNLPNVLFSELTLVAAFDPGSGEFRNFFLHKDRLFITTTKGLWFSKATDPTVWAVPDGGFVKLDSKDINYAFALNNSIYMLSGRGIDVFTYSIDPNEDAQVRTIAENFNAITGCVHKSIPYVANEDGIYTLSNNYVDRICSFREIYSGSVKRLVTMDDSIIVVSEDNNIPPFKGPIIFNVENQSVHTMWIPNMHGGTWHEDSSNEIVDAYTPSWSEDIWSPDPKTFFVAKYNAGYVSPNYNHVQTFYVMEHGRNNEPNVRGLDKIITNANGIQWMPIKYDIEIRDIQPDNNKYLKKKFRSLQILGRLPTDNFKLSISVDGYYYNRVHPLRGSNIDPYVAIAVNDQVAKDGWGGDEYLRMPTSQDIQGPHTFRVPINQRGVSLSLKFEVENWEEYVTMDPEYGYDPFEGTFRGILELIDIRYNWTYLGRPGTLKDNTSNPA